MTTSKIDDFSRRLQNDIGYTVQAIQRLGCISFQSFNAPRNIHEQMGRPSYLYASASTRESSICGHQGEGEQLSTLGMANLLQTKQYSLSFQQLFMHYFMLPLTLPMFTPLFHLLSVYFISDNPIRTSASELGW